jgi:AMP nucleosidase
MRTGTVATFDNRNWELRDQTEIVRQLSQSRAVALDMESATIAANGFRFRVPYGTLLCVSDKPLHGELKLPGMASDFYRTQVNRHLQIGLRAMEILRDRPHSSKLDVHRPAGTGCWASPFLCCRAFERAEDAQGRS